MMIPLLSFCAITYSAAQSMSPWNIDALVSLQGDLKLKVLLSAGLSDKLQIAAGGFLNAAEAQQVSKQHGNDEQIAKLIEILKGKQDKDFITFRSMLQDTNNEVWAKELEKRAEEFKRENCKCVSLCCYSNHTFKLVTL